MTQETFKIVYSRYVIHNVISSLYRLSIRRNLPLMLQHSLRRVTATLNCSTELSDQISSSVVSPGAVKHPAHTKLNIMITGVSGPLFWWHN